MKTFWELIRDSIYSLVLHIAPRFANVLLFMILGWLAGPSDAGVFVLATTYLLIFTTIMRGLDDLVVREVSRQPHEAKNYLIAFISFRLGLSLLLYGLLIVVVTRIFSYPPVTEKTIFILCLSLIPDNISYVCQSVLLGQRSFLSPTLIIGGVNLAKLILGSIVLYVGGNLVTIAWIWLICSSIGMVVILILSFKSIKYVDLQIRKSLYLFINQKKIILIFLLITTLTMLESQTDTILLSWFYTEKEVGLFGAATTITFSLIMFAQAYRFAVYPVMTRYALNQPEKLEQLYLQSLRYLGIIVFPIVGGIWVLAPTIVPLLFGEEFFPTINYLQLLVFVLIFVFLNEPNVRLLLVNDKQHWVVFFLLISAFMNVGANLLLLPKFAVYGAVMARLLSTFILFLMSYIYVKIKFMPISWTLMFVKPVIATVLMVVCIRYIANQQNLLVTIFVGMVLYFSLLILFGEISFQDIKRFAKSRPSKKKFLSFGKSNTK